MEEKNRWLLIFPTALGVLILNVLIHFLYMVVYSYLIAPGHDFPFYEAHAQFSGPYSSIIVGMPLMFFAGRWIGRKFFAQNRVKAALLVWLVYFVIDLSVIAAAGALTSIAVLFFISFLTKLGAAWLGGLSARSKG